MSKLEKALSLVRSGSYDEAESLFGELILSERDRSDALGNRAWMYRSIGRHQEAERDLLHLLEIDPDNAETVAVLAQVRAEMGQYVLALPVAVRALQLDARNTRAARVVVLCHKALAIDGDATNTKSTLLPNTPAAPFNPVLQALEAQQAGTFPISVFPQIGRLLYSICKVCRPRIVVETGSFIGYSGLCIAQALEENEYGHLHCFDLFGPVPEQGYESPVVGRKPTFLEVAQGHFDSGGLSARVTLHRGDSSETLRRIFEINKLTIDLAFIDGDHSLSGSMKDWLAVDEFLVEGGLVLLHDTNADECGWMGPRALLEELTVRAPDAYHWINLRTTERMGLAILQKCTPGKSPHWRPRLLDVIRDRLMCATMNQTKGS